METAYAVFSFLSLKNRAIWTSTSVATIDFTSARILTEYNILLSYTMMGSAIALKLVQYGNKLEKTFIPIGNLLYLKTVNSHFLLACLVCKTILTHQLLSTLHITETQFLHLWWLLTPVQLWQNLYLPAVRQCNSSQLCNVQSRGGKISQKSSSHLKIPGARRMTLTKFHTNDQQILGTTT